MTLVSLIGGLRPPEQTYSNVEVVSDFSMAGGEFIGFLQNRGTIRATFTEHLMAAFTPNIDMVYPNGEYLSAQPSLIIRHSRQIYYQTAWHRNFCKWAHNLNPAPPFFCLFRREALTGVDPRILIPQFFLRKKETLFVPSVEYTFDATPQYPCGENALTIWLLMVQERLQEHLLLCEKMSEKQSMISLNGLFLFCWDMLRNAEIDLAKDSFEKTMLRELSRLFEPIYTLRLPVIHQISEEDRKNMRTRCGVLYRRVLPYIEEVLQDDTLIHDLRRMMHDAYREKGSCPSLPNNPPSDRA